mgnify:FL=1|tara:strand:- start:45554 stop:46081 length:528 start_codon:yes stop_codon:yes gene_type:complete
MSRKIILETNRLQLSEFQINDSNFILKLVNSQNWIKYIGDRGITTIKDAENYLTNALIKSYSDLGYGLWLILVTETNTPIGMCGFLKRPYLDYSDIGFALLSEYEGKGFAFEAVNATIRYGKKTLQLNPILAITKTENKKSRNLLVKTGFTEKGNLLANEDQPDVLVYSNSSVIT